MHQRGEIELAGAQGLLEALSVVHRELHVDAGILASERRKQRREQCAAADPREAEAQRPALETAQLVELRGEVLARSEQGKRTPIDHLAGGGRRTTAASPDRPGPPRPR